MSNEYTTLTEISKGRRFCPMCFGHLLEYNVNLIKKKLCDMNLLEDPKIFRNNPDRDYYGEPQTDPLCCVYKFKIQDEHIRIKLIYKNCEFKSSSLLITLLSLEDSTFEKAKKMREVLAFV